MQHQLACGVTLQAPTVRRVDIRPPADAITNRGIAPRVPIPTGERDAIRVILSEYGLEPGQG